MSDKMLRQKGVEAMAGMLGCKWAIFGGCKALF